MLGVAYDGTGYGTDGTAWGGELLLADCARLRARWPRSGRSRSPGGDQAIREPWRIALALLDDAFDGAPPLERLPLFPGAIAESIGGRPRDDRSAASTRRSRTASAAYFDALGALVLARPQSRYEGQVALAWNLVADPTSSAALPVRDRPASARRGSSTCARWCGAVIGDVLIGRRLPAQDLGALPQHAGVGDRGDPCARCRPRRAALPVVLTGGCFQNARLAEGCWRRLSPDRRVLLHARRCRPATAASRSARRWSRMRVSRARRRDACA